MLCFVRYDDENGIWANRDQAIALMDQGHKVYKDNVNWEELSRSDLEKMVECDSTGADSVQEIKMYSK